MNTKLISASLLVGVLALSVIPAFAETSTTLNGTSTGTEMKKGRVALDGACMASAVDKRDTAVIAAWGTFHTAVGTALSTRRDALKAAWVLTDAKARRDALKAAWAAFNSGSRSARKAFNDARKAAWRQFGVDRKTCHGQNEDGSGEGSDANL